MVCFGGEHLEVISRYQVLVHRSSDCGERANYKTTIILIGNWIIRFILVLRDSGSDGRGNIEIPSLEDFN